MEIVGSQHAALPAPRDAGLVRAQALPVAVPEPELRPLAHVLGGSLVLQPPEILCEVHLQEEGLVATLVRPLPPVTRFVTFPPPAAKGELIDQLA